MAKQQKSYIQDDLVWLEARIASVKKYVDDNPIETLKDRVIQISTGRGEKDQITATVEQQLKSIRDTLKELPALLEAVDKLREREVSKDLEVRGGGNVPGMMKEYVK